MHFFLEYYTRNWVTRRSGLLQINRTYVISKTVLIRLLQNFAIDG